MLACEQRLTWYVLKKIMGQFEKPDFVPHREVLRMKKLRPSLMKTLGCGKPLVLGCGKPWALGCGKPWAVENPGSWAMKNPGLWKTLGPGLWKSSRAGLDQNIASHDFTWYWESRLPNLCLPSLVHSFVSSPLHKRWLVSNSKWDLHLWFDE